jgi:hypothetical protein
MIPDSYLEAVTGKEPESGAYNDGYTHEAIHTTFVLMETLSNHVMDTRCAKEFSDVRAAADAAHKALFDLYQIIGSKFKE